MKKFKTLYKKTSTGAIQYWDLSVNKNVIITKYGQVGGKEQETSDVIKEGKNIGKVNATTPEEQALAEAQSQWEKKKKKGYVETQKDAKADKTDDLIEGGIFPMLAHKFSEQGHKIKYPAYVQPKLDGIRCIAIVEDGECTLWSRTRKLITGVPHISAKIEKLFPQGRMVLDGELYNHEYKKDFEKIVHFVRQETPTEGHEVVEYHVYDCIVQGPFKERAEFVARLFKKNQSPLSWVQTHTVDDEEGLMGAFEIFLTAGYEGAMVRNTDSLYLNKRSYDLQKIKEFDDAEFKIVGIKEGRGKLAGHAGSFICETENGTQFEAKMKGDFETLKKYFEDHSLWKNKLLTVQYQGLTGKSQVPRFPIGLRLRKE